jgi:hypothetical protein
MEQQVQPDLLTFSEPKQTGTPAAINVLTILTFIGCGLQLIMTFLTKWFMSFALKVMDNPSRWEQLSTKEKDRLTQAKEAMALYEQYYIPLTIIGLVSIVLCFVGAMQMRKLKKQGFYIYLIGEYMPIIASAVLVGIAVQMNSPASAAFSIIIPVLFTVLYGMQLKHMK